MLGVKQLPLQGAIPTNVSYDASGQGQDNEDSG